MVGSKRTNVITDISLFEFNRKFPTDCQQVKRYQTIQLCLDVTASDTSYLHSMSHDEFERMLISPNYAFTKQDFIDLVIYFVIICI